MKSLIIKRSVVLNGHKTSVSLEDQFWNAMRDIAKERQVSVGQLIASIDHDRRHANLSSVLRLFVLGYYREQFEGAASDHGRRRKERPSIHHLR